MGVFSKASTPWTSVTIMVGYEPERVIKLQLAICLYSDAHRQESMVTDFYEPLKRMYEQLSHGVAFDSLDAIGQRQRSEALRA